MPALALSLSLATRRRSGSGDTPLPPEPPVAHDNFLAIEGDSISAGTVVSTTPYAVTSFNAISAVGDTKHMFAASGSQIGDVEGRAATVDAAFVAGNLNALSILIGVNDMIVGGLPDNSFFDRLKNYCNARKNAGWRVILCTLLPASSNASYETWRLAVNGWIRSDASFYDALADFGADAVMGVFAAPADSSLYADGVHPTQAGQDLLAAIFEPALTAMFARNANPVVAQPTFSVAPGGYLSGQTVTLATATSGARIKYTTDGSVPTQTHGTRYSSPVAISATKTLRAIAYKYAYGDSVVTSGLYTIDATSRPDLGAPSVVFETFADEATSIVNRAPQFGGTSNGNSVLYGHPTFTSKGAGFAWDKFLNSLLTQTPNLTWLLIGQFDVSVNNLPIGNYNGVGGDTGLTIYTGGGALHVHAESVGDNNGGPAGVIASMDGVNWNAAFLTSDGTDILTYCPVDSTTVPIFTLSGTVQRPARTLRIGSCPFSASGGFSGPMNVAFFAAWPRALSSAEVASVFAAVKAYLTSSRSLTVQG